MDGVAVVEGGVVYYVRTDRIGRPVFATDGSGAKVWEATYLPFGEVLATSGNPIALRFPGQWFQAESGLHQNWMRDYDPTTGRYMQADPLGLVDGASVYGYVGQNPGRYVDPRGEYLVPVARGLIFAYRWGRAFMFGKTAMEAVGGAAIPGQDAQRETMVDTGEVCQSGCPPCRSASTAQIVPLGSFGHRYDPNSRGHHPYKDGEHVHLYDAMQNPNNCQCFWHNQRREVDPPPFPGSLDITQHPLTLLWGQ